MCGRAARSAPHHRLAHRCGASAACPPAAGMPSSPPSLIARSCGRRGVPVPRRQTPLAAVAPHLAALGLLDSGDLRVLPGLLPAWRRPSTPCGSRAPSPARRPVPARGPRALVLPLTGPSGSSRAAPAAVRHRRRAAPLRLRRFDRDSLRARSGDVHAWAAPPLRPFSHRPPRLHALPAAPRCRAAAPASARAGGTALLAPPVLRPPHLLVLTRSAAPPRAGAISPLYLARRRACRPARSPSTGFTSPAVAPLSPRPLSTLPHSSHLTRCALDACRAQCYASSRAVCLLLRAASPRHHALPIAHLPRACSRPYGAPAPPRDHSLTACSHARCAPARDLRAAAPAPAVLPALTSHFTLTPPPPRAPPAGVPPRAPVRAYTLAAVHVRVPPRVTDSAVPPAPAHVRRPAAFEAAVASWRARWRPLTPRLLHRATAHCCSPRRAHRVCSPRRVRELPLRTRLGPSAEPVLRCHGLDRPPICSVCYPAAAPPCRWDRDYGRRARTPLRAGLSRAPARRPPSLATSRTLTSRCSSA